MIVPLTAEDANVLAFFMREDDAREVLATHYSDYRHEFADACMRWGGWCCKTANGIPVAMGGVVEAWPGVGTAWMVATPDLPQHGLEVTRFARKLIADSVHLHRVQAFSAAFHTVSHAWLEALGFERGPLMRKMGKGGEDFIVFEIVR